MLAIKTDNLAKYLNALMYPFQILLHRGDARVTSSSLWQEVKTTTYTEALQKYHPMTALAGCVMGNLLVQSNKAVNCQSSCKSRKKVTEATQV